MNHPGEFGIPLNHPESASLLEMGPGRWLNAISRDKAVAAAIQLHRDVCLMTTNLDILDQYALSLQGTASADVAAGALVPHFCSDGGYGAVAALYV